MPCRSAEPRRKLQGLHCTRPHREEPPRPRAPRCGSKPRTSKSYSGAAGASRTSISIVPVADPLAE
jgi:hypothetical protein